MTKDGRPSLLNDIRYFYGPRKIEHNHLQHHEDAVAFGRRIALFLNGRAISLGAYTALYLQFNPSKPPGTIEVSEEVGGAEDWWQRYTQVGVPKNFLELPNASEIVMDGTVEALKTIVPHLAPEIDEVAKIVREQAEKLRILVRVHRSKRYIVEVSFNIAKGKKPSYLYVALTDRSNGDYSEALPFPLKLYRDAIHLAGSIKINGSTVIILPKQSFNAKFTADGYRDWLSKPISDFTQIDQRPVMSEIIKLRG